ncbi:MAG: alpha/beta hydrolase [Anaerolineae bacterium]
MPFVEIATGARLHYEEWNNAAAGDPVIVVHGMLGTATVDLAETNEYIASLGWRVIAPTLRGYGESTPKPRDFPPRFYDRDAADVMAFCDALGIERAHLVGYSDGGEVVLVCAGQYPERCLSVAAWGAVGYFGEQMRPVAQNPRMISGEAITPEEVALHGIDPVQFGRSWVRAVVQYIDSGGDVSLSRASQITCPLLLMLGHEDRLNPAAFAQQFLAQAGHGELVMFDCGHAIHTEQPEAFRRTLAAFLRRPDEKAG